MRFSIKNANREKMINENNWNYKKPGWIINEKWRKYGVNGIDKIYRLDMITDRVKYDNKIENWNTSPVDANRIKSIGGGWTITVLSKKKAD